MKKENSKKKVVVANAPTTEKKANNATGKIEMVNIFSTTYGYYRWWVKNILADGGISKFRFVKDTDSYNGQIAVAKTEVEKAKKVLAEYQKKNPDTVIMWK